MKRLGAWEKIAHILACLAIACEGSLAAGEKPFVFALWSKEPITSLSPLEAPTSTRLMIEAEIMEGLMRFDPKNPDHPLPNLALEYFAIDPLTYVFRLRRNVYFHPFRGHPKDQMTAADVVFSLTLAKKSGSLMANRLEDIDYVRAVGKDIVKIKLKQANKHFLSILATSIAHVTSEAYFKSLGPDDSTRTEAFKKAPIGTGPYHLKQPLKENSETITLERFESFRDQRWVKSESSIPRVRFRFIADPHVIAEGLLAGSISLASLPLTESANGANFRDWQGTITVLKPPFLSILAINTSKQRLTNTAIRRLLNAAVEKEEIERICPSELESLPEGYGYYLRIPRRYLREKAADELQQSRAAPGALQQLDFLRKAGPLLILLPDRPDHIIDELVESVARSLRKHLGLKTEILKSGSAADEARRSNRFDLIYEEWTPDTPWEQTGLSVLELLFSSKSSDNLAKYSNPEVNKAFEDLRRVNSAEATYKAYKKIRNQLLADPPHIWLPTVRHTTLLLTQDFRADYAVSSPDGLSSASALVYYTSILKEIRRAR